MADAFVRVTARAGKTDTRLAGGQARDRRKPLLQRLLRLAVLVVGVMWLRSWQRRGRGRGRRGRGRSPGGEVLLRAIQAREERRPPRKLLWRWTDGVVSTSAAGGEGTAGCRRGRRRFGTLPVAKEATTCARGR